MCGLSSFIPAKVSIHFLDFLDSRSRYPGLDPELPGMTTELFNGFQKTGKWKEKI
jgi:hypothetical protein